MILKNPLLALCSLVCVVDIFGGQLARAADSLRFEKDIVPILYHHCFACHSEKQTQPKGDLLLDTAEGILRRGVIVPGNPDASELIKRVSLPHTEESVMPPLKGGAQPLNDSERAMLRQWIADGAKLDSWSKFDHRGVVAAPSDTSLANADVRQLSEELQKRVDQIHASKGTTLNAPANDETFLRRVYLDVVGRIPSLEESSRFLESKDPNKRRKLIDELLNSEGYVSHMFNWKADLLRVNTRVAPGQPGKFYDDWVKDAIRSHMPYDEFVRRLITASGYLWENGAAGFYVRDLGMPLDHMSNLTRVFLGTRIECAQCHDHPLEPITQKDFFQMVAFTFSVSSLGSPGGYSNNNVRQWPELKAKLAAMGSDKLMQDSVSVTIAPLKRLTTDTEMHLKYPNTYTYDEALRGQVVEPRTLFGDEAVLANTPTRLDEITSSVDDRSGKVPESSEGNSEFHGGKGDAGERRRAFAEWLTSPRNPRFAKNIANRLWKRVMGTALIEPVDSLSVLSNTEHAALIDFLTETMIHVRFDERTFMAVLLNTRLYQSQSVREMPEPTAICELRGPQLRRLSAEQIWDSHLVLLVKDIDERKSTFRLTGVLDPVRLRKLTNMTADEIIEQSRVDRAEHTRHREFLLRLAEQKKERAAAEARGDEKEVQRLTILHAKENKDSPDSEMTSMNSETDSETESKEADPRWKSLPSSFIRASETPLPLPLGHFLRQFGQSDRREIDAFNRDPNTTHSLALMNGELTTRVLKEDSLLRRQLSETNTQGERRTQLIYRAILVRSATNDELAEMTALTKNSPTPEQDMIWALMNSPEFLFNQ